MASQITPDQRSDPPIEEPRTTIAAHPSRRSRRQSSEGLDRQRGGADFSLLVLRRIGFSLVVLLAIVYFTFFGLEMARGSTAVDALRHGFTAGAGYLSRLASGNLGTTLSASTGVREVQVSEVLWSTVSRSLGLLGVSLFLAVLVGVPLGAWAARRRRSNASLVTLIISLAGMSLPSFFVALLLQMAVIKWVRIFGGAAPLPVGGFGWDLHIVLPALVLATRPLAQIARITFLSLSEVLDEDYIRTARSKGLSRSSVWRRHVYRNAAIPILSTLLASLHFSLSSMPIVERFFSWPGIGFGLLRAIARQDDNLTIILLLCLGGLFLLFDVIMEALCRRIDPRIRDQQDSGISPGHSVRASLLDLGTVVRDAMIGLVQRMSGGLRGSAPRQDLEDHAFRDLLQERISEGQYYEVTESDRRSERRKTWLQATVGNLSFVLGAILLIGLLVVVIFGADIAPDSPYTTRGLGFIDGKISSPPFPPSVEFPWGTDMIGRDVMSLVLVGARRTLSMAVLIVLARMVIGFLLGAIAGWSAGSTVDRLIMGLSGIIAPFPALLLAMILILALGIREGVSTFVIAFCFVGWGQIMQYVRGEVMTTRPKLFIEGARAVGLRTFRILYSHVLPNLVSALIVLAALEMGAVLMLLAELGFLDIFIGGGTFAELNLWMPPYHYSDVPEWGAMLSNVRLGARSWPWTAIYPSLAFALSILAFNLFGEGLRRMIDRVGVGFTRLINRTTILAAVVFVMGIQWAGQHVGPSTYYRRYAETFSGQNAMEHVQVLADPALEGRAPGTLGQDAAAEYVADKFESYGLQMAGEGHSYFQTKPYDVTVLDAEPRLEVHDGGPLPAYRRDYVEFQQAYTNLDRISGQVRWLGLGQMLQRGALFTTYTELENLDFGSDILLLLSDDILIEFGRYLGRYGSLIVVDDPATLERRSYLHGLHGDWFAPSLWVSEDLADRLLIGTGQTVESLREVERTLGQDEIASLATGVEVTAEVSGELEEMVPVRHVIGHMPGMKPKIESTYVPENQMDNQLIMVVAQYDGVGVGPSGAHYPGANDNCSGVAVMLEAVRIMQETDYQPNRTLLFVAYAGEATPHGLALGEPMRPAKFLDARRGFSSFSIEAVIYLRGLGWGTEPVLELAAGGSQRLTSVFEDSARSMGVKTVRAGEGLDLSVVFEEGDMSESVNEAPTIQLSTAGFFETSHTPADTIEAISSQSLEDAGRTLALALMVMGRERDY